ncbi:hypothetical protein [Lutimaribacter saemankumensis]|uniref:Uncharacterized protein n=1 Tax=Lutimaribacter saemankumensis TaxID=490829 RepID=A0A1G8T657_9RHOB|nr:hypothetical protein [Lutimaribacter saemankumensis]SDJ36190.1 hypothetical protein SAMN05421850_11612 [Lutimaribacter saemankumensis]
MARITGLFVGLALSFGFSTGGAAGEESSQASDYVLNFEEASNLTSFGVLSFPGLGQSLFSDNGTYLFTDEATSSLRLGVFEVKSDGKVCIDFHDDSSHCDVFIRRGGLYFLLREDGGRFPVFFRLEGQ